jgi:hypothetical protein
MLTLGSIFHSYQNYLVQRWFIQRIINIDLATYNGTPKHKLSQMAPIQYMPRINIYLLQLFSLCFFRSFFYQTYLYYVRNTIQKTRPHTGTFWMDLEDSCCTRLFAQRSSENIQITFKTMEPLHTGSYRWHSSGITATKRRSTESPSLQSF